MEPRFHHLAGGIDTKIIPDSAPKIQCLSEPMTPIFHLKKSFCRQYHFDIKAKYEMYFSYSKKSYFIEIFLFFSYFFALKIIEMIKAKIIALTIARLLLSKSSEKIPKMPAFS